MLERKKSFATPELLFRQRVHWLSMVEQMAERHGRALGRNAPAAELKALTHYMDTYLDRIATLDEALNLGWAAWVGEHKIAIWDVSRGVILGWRAPRDRTEQWDVDEDEIDEEHEATELQMQLYAKEEAYEAALIATGAEAILRGVQAGVDIQEIIVTPKLDPRAVGEEPEGRTATMAVREVNQMLGQGAITELTARALLKASVPDGFVLDTWALPREGWVQVTVHNLARVMVQGDRRFGSLYSNRKRLERYFQDRGIKVRDITLFTPGRGDSAPMEVDFKAQFLVTESLLEWLRGERTVWYGGEGSTNELWGTYTPRDAVWLYLEGNDADTLNLWVHKLVLSCPRRWRYSKVMQLIQRRIRAAGWDASGRGPGPVRAVGSRMIGGKMAFCPWYGPDARYMVLVKNRSEAEVWTRVLGTIRQGVKLCEGRLFQQSRHKATICMQPLLADEEEEEEEGLIPMSVKPTWLTQWNVVRVTKEALEIDSLTPQAMQEGILERIWRELEWTRGKLHRIKVRAGPTGHWNRSWVILFWDAAHMFHAQAFLKMVNCQVDLDREAETGSGEFADWARVDADRNGNPRVYTRYDFWVSRGASKQATSGLVAVLQDARDADFQPPTLDKNRWVIHTETTDGDECMDIAWIAKGVPEQFKRGQPDLLNCHPEARVTELERKAMAVLVTLYRQRDQWWWPAREYNRERADYRWSELAPRDANHHDARKAAIVTPRLAEVLAEPDAFYGALGRLIAQGVLFQERRDGGLIVTRKAALPELTGTSPERKGTVTAGCGKGWGGYAARNRPLLTAPFMPARLLESDSNPPGTPHPGGRDGATPHA